MEKRNLAPNSVRASSYDLIYFFRFLDQSESLWENLSHEQFTDFVFFLRHTTSNGFSRLPSTSKNQARSDSSIQRIVSSIVGFYRYYAIEYGITNSFVQSGQLEFSKSKLNASGLLSFAAKSRPNSVVQRSKKQLIRTTTSLRKPKTLNPEEQLMLISACCNQRDRLMMLLMFESGMRIGQVLGLKHEDIDSRNSSIRIKPRLDNPNQAYAKSRKEYSVQISSQWLNRYTDFLIGDLNQIDSDFVFTKLYRKDRGDPTEPLEYSSITDLFKRINKKTGLSAHAHIARHTTATELLENGVPLDIVSKQLGHASVETTRSIYEHISGKKMREALNLD
jgi:integrase